MIVIITNSKDLSSTIVTEWLVFWRKDVCRINLDEDENLVFENMYLSKNHQFVFSFRQKNRIIEISEDQNLWVRRLSKLTKDMKNKLEMFPVFIQKYLQKEAIGLSNIFFTRVLAQNSIVNIFNNNKINVLKEAQTYGINIPEFIITSSKKELILFCERHKRVISKPITDPTILKHKKKALIFYTKEILQNFVERLPDSFFPSLLQEYIEKLYEIRVMYLEGNFYSMVIFSQKDDSTRIDYRQYNVSKMNRMMPYSLPSSLKKKLGLLMKKLGLSRGVIDLIKGKDDKYYFLEVNTEGQFGTIEKNCNWYLHKMIAKFLIK